MRTANKLIKVKNWLDAEAAGPQIGSDYFEIAELLVSSINDVRARGLANNFERTLEHCAPDDPDSLNQYEKAIQWVEQVPPDEKWRVEVYTELPEIYQDMDVECLFVKITDESTNLYIIPYDKTYKVLREL